MTKEEYKRRQIESARMFADFHKSGKTQRFCTALIFLLGAVFEVALSFIAADDGSITYRVCALLLVGGGIVFWKIWTKDMNRWLELRQECLDKANRL